MTSSIIVICSGLIHCSNVGTIIRHSVAFGCSKIYLCPPTRKEVTELPKHIQSSFKEEGDSVVYTKSFIDKSNRISCIHRFEKGIEIIWNQSEEKALNNAPNMPIYVLENNIKPCMPINKVSFAQEAVIVCGGEHHGVRKEIYIDKDFTAVYIPCKNAHDSLNVGVALSIALYSTSF